MRIARFTTGSDPRYAIVDGEDDNLELIVLSGDPMYTPGAPTGERIPLTDDVRLLAPVIPRSKAVCLGKNYEAHAKEIPHRGPAPDLPILFLKPNTAVIGPDDPIVMPPYSEDVQLEAELAVVIGRLCKDVSPESALDYVYGYTCANDVTARDLQRRDNQWARAKGMDTFCPLGPWIETDLDVSSLRVTSRLDGETRQDGNTADMVHGIGTLIETASAAFTLLPGDVILTGTPAGVGLVQPGQRVEVEIEGIGVLANPFVAAD